MTERNSQVCTVNATAVTRIEQASNKCEPLA
jgi:hypothetical protein